MGIMSDRKNIYNWMDLKSIIINIKSFIII